MRRIAVRVFVALLTFILGLFLYAFSQSSGLSDCVPGGETTIHAETEIAKTVFRFNIQHLLSDADSPTYYLAQSEGRDAREDVVVGLQREGLSVRRISQLGMNRGPSFDCYYCPKGPAEFVLRLGNIRWVNDNEVFVGSSSRRWSLNTDRAYLYHVVLEGDRWVIKDYELL